jgi:hypothetical protein
MVQFQAPNIYGAFTQGMADGRNRLRNDMQDAETARLGQARNALSQAIQSGGADSDGARNALAMLDPGSAMTMQREDARNTRNFDRGVLESDRGFAFQQQGRQIQQANATAAQGRAAASAQRTADDDVKRQNQKVGVAILTSISRLPPEQQEEAYQKGLRVAVEQYGMDVSNLPRNVPDQAGLGVLISILSGQAPDMRGAGGGMAGGMGAAPPEYGLTPQRGVDANGNPVLIQLSKGGQAAQVVMPDGVTLSPPLERVDTGTEVLFVNPQTGQVMARSPLNVAGAAAAAVTGAAAGQAVVDAPAALKSAESMLASIDGIINDPELANATGLFSFVPINVPGFNANVRARMDQLGGKAFLQAFESLKGGGVITDREGEKATQAIARLETAVKKEQYVEALNDLKAVVEGGMAKLRGLAANERTWNPATGDLE